MPQPPLLHHQSPKGDGAQCDNPKTGNTTLSQLGIPREGAQPQERHNVTSNNCVKGRFNFSTVL